MVPNAAADARRITESGGELLISVMTIGDPVAAAAGSRLLPTRGAPLRHHHHHSTTCC